MYLNYATTTGIVNCLNMADVSFYETLTDVAIFDLVPNGGDGNVNGFVVRWNSQFLEKIDVYIPLIGQNCSVNLETQEQPYIQYGDWLFVASIVIFLLSFVTWGYFASVFKPKRPYDSN